MVLCRLRKYLSVYTWKMFVFLSPLGNRDEDVILAKVECYLWLGVTRSISDCFDNLPGGFSTSYSDESPEDTPSIPRTLHYFEKHVLELRAYLFQARSLPRFDLNHHPRIFARVSVGHHSQTTQVVEDNWNPIWDQMLVFREIVFYGDLRRFDPPDVIVEVIDYNNCGSVTSTLRCQLLLGSNHGWMSMGIVLLSIMFSWMFGYHIKLSAPFNPSDLVRLAYLVHKGKSRLLGRTITSVGVNGDSPIPPCLQWYDAHLSHGDVNGQILAAFKLSQKDDADSYRDFGGFGDAGEDPVMPIPPEIRPRISAHRIEVLFWGIRELKRVHWQVVRPQIDLECAGKIIRSCVISDYQKHSNFVNTVDYLDMDLPDEVHHLPSLTIKLMNLKSFGREQLIATHVVSSVQNYAFQPRVCRPILYRASHSVLNMDDFGHSSAGISQNVAFPWTLERRQIIGDEEEEEMDWWSRYYISIGQSSAVEAEGRFGRTSLAGDSQRNQPKGPRSPRNSILEPMKFRNTQASIDMGLGHPIPPTPPPNAMGFVVYPCELENVTEYGGFKEWLHSFELIRGKKFTRNAPREEVVAILKGCFRIYKTPLPRPASDHLLPITEDHELLFEGLPMNTPTKVLIRAYIIKANDLSPTDVGNSTDAYPVIQLGSHRLRDRENYIPNLLNPVFGKCFEFVATLPTDSILHVQLFDFDRVGKDDLIGETIIDLENRYYSRHRPTCGLGRFYETSGPNAWRDALKPTQILAKLCQDDRLDGPYIMDVEREIRIGSVKYKFGEDFKDDETGTENMALCLLHRWSEISPGSYQLIPEHTETRTLYNPKKPGKAQKLFFPPRYRDEILDRDGAVGNDFILMNAERGLRIKGQLVMWLDMFEENTAPPSMPRDISTRNPESFELRVIIWNTDDVILADDAFFTGEKMSDIYVKGWLTGKEDAQSTDVHYRSLTGEGNFNWRFVYPFKYLKVEKKIVVLRKVSLYSWVETEFKQPPNLELQVFDADRFKADDRLGAITLDLNRFPRGAKSSRLCSLQLLDGTIPQVCIFKQRRVRGWWPLTQRKSNGEMELTGKVEAEIQLLSEEEAEKSPAGRARKEPDALPAPKRPETSFVNFLNPLKTLRYAFWRNYKGKIIKFLMLVALAFLLVLFFYSMPGYAAKRILGA